METRLPGATPWPLAMAAEDIMDDAREPPAIPLEVKPIADITNGANSMDLKHAHTH